MNPTIFKWSSKAGVLALALALASPCRANLAGPYTADVNTLHLWHLDELATPCIDAVATGGTNLAGLAGGATLGNASFTGFGNALNTAPGGALKGDLLSPSPTAANVTMTVADTVSGAFTFEAIVQIAFDPTVNSTAACEILSGESGTAANRIFQWRIAPKGFTLITGIVATNSPFMTFENIRGGVAGQGTIYAPIPTTGPDAIVSNGWYHVAITYNGSPGTGGNIVFYWTAMDPTRISASPLTINSAVTTLTGLNPLATITTPFMLGNQARNKNGNFLGLIDEVRISKIARNSAAMMFAPSSVAIITNPNTNTLAAAGDTVSLSVTAGGGGTLTYQWQFNGNNILSTTNSTATNSTLVLSNITALQAGNYKVLVSNGASSATSTVATVTVGGVLAGLFNTGVDNSSALLPGGSSDSHWQLVASTDPNFPGPSTYVVSSPVPQWLANGPSSQWLAPGDGANMAGGLYTYQTTFFVDTFDPATAQITGGWISDNLGQNIILNGTSLNITNTASLASFTLFTITNGFVPGLNVLQCIVSNAPGTGNNPSGLRVQARGVALPLAPTAPQIVNAPAPVTSQTRQSAAFTVGAFGSAPLTYQWFFGASPLAGQTGRTLALANLTTGQAGNYTVVVSNSVGATNATVALAVTQPPAVTWLGFTTGDWDTTTTNWLDTVNLTNTTFSMLDDVIFDGNGSGQPIVNLTAPLTLNSLSVNAANDYTFSSASGGSLSGSFSLTKDNTGTLILDTTNTYSGSTTIVNGTIQVGNGDANGTLGTGAVTNNAALVFKRTDTVFVTPSISGSGSLTMAGSGVAVLTGNNSYTGPTVVQSGQINVRSVTGLGTADSGTTVLDGAQLFMDFGINIGAEPLTLGGFGLASDGALRKGGATASIFGGPITLSDAAGIGVDGNSSLTLTNPAAITSTDIPLSVQCLTGGTLIVAGKIGLGAGSITEFGSGTVTLTALNNAWTGGTTISTGSTLQIGDGGNDGSYGVGGGIIDNGTLIINSSNNISIPDPISNGGLLTQAGAGTLTLPNPNSSFSGPIHINGFGSLVPGDSAALGSGILTIGASQTDTSKLVLNGGIVLPNQIAIFPRAFGVLNNPANVQNVSGVNVLNPPSAITLNSGGNLFTLESDSGDLILSNSASVLIATGVGRDFVLKGAGKGEIYGGITTSGGAASVLIWKLDSGTWTLWGANAPAAGTTISNGTLIINGSMDTNLITVAGGTLGGTGAIAGSVLVNSGATFAPTIASLGPIGTMTISNTLTLQAGSTTAVQINKTLATNDQVVGLTSAVCGGSLVVSNLGGTLAAGDSFPLFVSAKYSGAFTSITPASPGAGLRWNLSSPGVDGTLRVASTNISKPTITGVTSSSSAITLAAAGGTAGGPVLLLSSTNVNAPLSSWTRVSTNVFDGTGHLSVSNLIAPTGSKFFALQAQ